MKKTLLLYLLLTASVPVLLAQPAEFDFTPSNISGGIIAEVQVDGVPATGDDWIAAFNDDGNCVGAAKLVEYYGLVLCLLQIYEDLEIDYFYNKTAYTFKLWVAANNTILNHPMNIETITSWDNPGNGEPFPNWDFTDERVLNFISNPCTPPSVGSFECE